MLCKVSGKNLQVQLFLKENWSISKDDWLCHFFIVSNIIFFLFSEVECSDFEISEMELESRLQGRKIGAEAAFSCPTGFNLIGRPKLHCLSNGRTKTLSFHFIKQTKKVLVRNFGQFKQNILQQQQKNKR
jgi:hypothetical protein